MGEGGVKVSGDDRREQVKRLWVLALMLVVVVVAGRHFLAIATSPMYDIHSDDVLIIERFVARPRVVSVERDFVLTEEAIPPRYEDPQGIREYWAGIDHPALERWIYHYLLKWTGRMPEELPGESWDYGRDFQWNKDQGHVAPAEARRFVRVVNAAFMIAAAVLIYIGVARGVSAGAGLAAAVFFTVHTATFEVVWSLGQDPLMWMMMAAALVAWAYMGETRRGAVVVGVLAGLATAGKLNGGFVVAGYCVWMVLKGRWRDAVLSGAIAVAVFVVVNPIVWSRGVLGAPGVMWEMVAWRRLRGALYAQHWGEYASAGRLRLVMYLLGNWWVAAALFLVSRRVWGLKPAVWWAGAIMVGNLVTVTAPPPRYVFPIQAALGVGLVAAYWPVGMGYHWRRLKGVVRGIRGG